MLATACAPIRVPPPFTPCELGQECMPWELQPSQFSGSHAGGGKVWTGCWRSLPESGDNVGAPNMPRGGRPPQNCLLLTLPLSAAVLSLSWLPSGTAGPHLVLGRRMGAGGPLSKPTGPV